MHASSRWYAALAVLIAALAWSSAAEAYLTYTLPGPLKQDGCQQDGDGDCLDDSAEEYLAWIMGPNYFHDEDEDCDGNVDPVAFGRRDFYQVRPEGDGVSGWSPGDGTTKWVHVTYFLLYPRDCQSHFGFGGHQGDSEHVRYWLYSTDLRTWHLYSGRYWHHGRHHDFSGSYLQSRAGEIGSAYPSIAADEDGHGSWAGKSGGSSHCAGSEDDFCHGTCDCFVGSMASAKANGHYEWVLGAPSTQDNNVGGPWPEVWNESAVSVEGSAAYTALDTGFGLLREYWTYQPGFVKFCGWECPQRDGDGDCTVERYGDDGCSSGLHGKVDTVGFSP